MAQAADSGPTLSPLSSRSQVFVVHSDCLKGCGEVDSETLIRVISNICSGYVTRKHRQESQANHEGITKHTPVTARCNGLDSAKAEKWYPAGAQSCSRNTGKETACLQGPSQEPMYSAGRTHAQPGQSHERTLKAGISRRLADEATAPGLVPQSLL